MPEFRLRQNGKTVAKVICHDIAAAEIEIHSYAMQYRAEGAVTVERQQRMQNGNGKWYWKRHALFEQWPPESSDAR